jgi:hypothetical protein
LCCALYLAHDENGEYIGEGWLPEYIELWIERFVTSGALRVTQSVYAAGTAGVEPLHDPRLSHPPTPEAAAYRATLPETGCLLPHEFRAPICGEYRCQLWDEGAT